MNVLAYLAMPKPKSMRQPTWASSTTATKNIINAIRAKNQPRTDVSCCCPDIDRVAAQENYRTKRKNFTNDGVVRVEFVHQLK